jgi:hypothetical protein
MNRLLKMESSSVQLSRLIRLVPFSLCLCASVFMDVYGG